MTRRYPARVLLLWALAGLLVVAPVGLFGYGRFGGTSPNQGQPHRWVGEEPLVISHHAGLSESSWCRVRPADGEDRTFEVNRRSSGSLRIQVEHAWFDGEAQVACQRAKLLTAPDTRPPADDPRRCAWWRRTPCSEG